MTPELVTLKMDGLRLGPAQAWGAIRLVPILRDAPVEGLRMLDLRDDEDLSSGVGLVPHGHILRWDAHGLPLASFGTQLVQRKVHIRRTCLSWRLRRGSGARMLPIGVDFEGQLAACFRGPDAAWTAFAEDPGARYAGAAGVRRGDDVEGLADALRAFEILHAQCGLLVFVSEALAAALILPDAHEYRRLHRAVLEDFFGELFVHYARLPGVEVEIDDGPPRGSARLDEIRRRVRHRRAHWAEYSRDRAKALFDEPLPMYRHQHVKGFTLRRIRTRLTRGEAQQLGEVVFAPSGEVAYLKAFRLSAQQTKRARLLEALEAQSWNLGATAKALGVGEPVLEERLRNQGFGYLLSRGVLAAARRRKR